MHLADVLIAVAVLLVSLWLGRRAVPWARVALPGSALLISAVMFLPSGELRTLMDAGMLASMESKVRAMAWELADVVHFLAFLWLALVLWTLRPDLRGWRVVAVLLVLAVTSELMQGLTSERSTRVGDVAVNLLGAGVGLVLAVAGAVLWRVLHPRPVPNG